jgi:hypothetical protein
MKSIKHLAAHPVSLPLAADDILEFHAARLLLLLEVCGTAGRIDGLTKMAKLDFFNRYPDFFAAASAAKSAGALTPAMRWNPRWSGIIMGPGICATTTYLPIWRPNSSYR